MASASPLFPTYYGHIASTQDALLLFEACLTGSLNHVARRPHDRERSSLIKSGNIFIYEEHSSGIKRWTDGVPWSPSRILGNFLVYRELERPFPPGEKKRAMKRTKLSLGIGKAQEPFGASSSTGMSGGNYKTPAVPSYLDSSSNAMSKETERSLIGSLVDSYGFKEEGLVKKTVSVTVGGVSHHLVSYYTVADVTNNKLTTPSNDPRFQHTVPRADLTTKQNFRTPIDEVDSMDSTERAIYSAYPGYPRNAYEMTNQSLSTRSVPISTPPVTYPQTNMYGSYGLSSPIGHDSNTANYSLSSYNNQFVPSPIVYPTSKAEHDDITEDYRQRYNSMIGMGSVSSRGQLPPTVPTNFGRRDSMYESDIGSGLSRISTCSADSKVSSDSGYGSQSFYSGSYRDDSSISQGYAGQRSLPTPNQGTPFDRSSYPYSSAESLVGKGNLRSLGISSGDNSHYLVPQQQWTSTGTS